MFWKNVRWVLTVVVVLCIIAISVLATPNTEVKQAGVPVQQQNNQVRNYNF